VYDEFVIFWRNRPARPPSENRNPNEPLNNIYFDEHVPMASQRGNSS
jgi:hypothetical protein